MTKTQCLFVVSAAFGGIVSAKANFIVNGSFELPADAGGFTYFSDGVPGGWVDGGTAGFEIGAGSQVTGFDGLQVMGITTSYEQSAKQTLNVGAGIYTLSYEVGRSSGYVGRDAGEVGIYWNGTLLQSVRPMTYQMQTYTYEVTSLGGGDTVLVGGSGYGNGDAAFVDNVILNPVPEPATWAIFAVGGACLLRRRTLGAV